MSYFDPSTGILQGASNGITLQGSSPQLQASNGSGLRVQPAAQQHLQNTVAPGYNQSLGGGGARRASSLSSTAVDPAQAAADAAAAAEAQKVAQANALRTNITQLVNGIKDIFNSRYGAVDTIAGEQTGKLNQRLANETSDVTQQVTDNNNQAGAAYAAKGTRDSSDYGNTVDTLTRGGESQIRDLGTELQDNLAKIGAWLIGQKSGFDASKGGLDAVVRHAGEETDPGRLTDLRNTLEAQTANERGKQGDYASNGQSAQALASIAPSTARAVQLKTTLSQIIAGSADPGTKSKIGQSLIANSGLTSDEQQKLNMAFSSDLASAEPQKQEVAPTA